jgi:hypothetical protein
LCHLKTLLLLIVDSPINVSLVDFCTCNTKFHIHSPFLRTFIFTSGQSWRHNDLTSYCSGNSDRSFPKLSMWVLSCCVT